MTNSFDLAAKRGIPEYAVGYERQGSGTACEKYIERIAELEAAGDALASQAAHVRIGASIPAMNIHDAAIELGPLVDAWYRARAALKEKGKDDG